MLFMIFVVESAIMTVFAFAVGETQYRWLGVLVDSSVLTLVMAPLMYRLIVSPLRQLADERSRLLAHVIEAQDTERRRVARDLHDEIGQSFTSLLVRMRLLEEATNLDTAKAQAGELREFSGRIYDQIRNLASGLYPTVLDDLGLVEAVRRMAEDFEAINGASVNFRTCGISKERLPRQVESTAYRVVQESLTNCAKHAHANSIDINLARGADELIVTIVDNGRGFEASKVDRRETAATFGLSAMRERALLLRGSVEVHSGPKAGTRVTLRLPLRE
jgi:signal transduction histidine kinase